MLPVCFEWATCPPVSPSQVLQTPPKIIRSITPSTNSSHTQKLPTSAGTPDSSIFSLNVIIKWHLLKKWDGKHQLKNKNIWFCVNRSAHSDLSVIEQNIPEDSFLSDRKRLALMRLSSNFAFSSSGESRTFYTSTPKCCWELNALNMFTPR